MTLEIVQPLADGTGGINNQLLGPRYWLHYELPTGQHVYDFTGGLTLNFKSSHMDRYDYEDVMLSLLIEEGLPNDYKLPNSTKTRYYQLNAGHWEASANLMSIANDSTATNAGWVIDEVDFVSPGSFRRRVQVRIRVGARDTDGWVLKIGYRLAVVGTVSYHDVPPIQ